MKSTDERLVELEVMVTHLQRTIQVLDEVVIDQGRTIDVMQRELRTLSQDLRVLREVSREPRRAEDEIPPHY